MAILAKGTNSLQATSPAFFHHNARRTAATSTELREVIRGTKEEELMDEGLGGVRLAMESVIKIHGTAKTIKKKESEDGVIATGMKRYKKMTEFSASVLQDVSDHCGNTVVCTGHGKESYSDPGDTLDRNIALAPIQAAKDALSKPANEAINTASGLVINIVGGDDLMLHESMGCVQLLVGDLDIPKKCQVTFNSLCHSSFPGAQASVTVVATADARDRIDEFSDVSKSMARGEVYFAQGKWWTVLDEDVNTAKE